MKRHIIICFHETKIEQDLQLWLTIFSLAEFDRKLPLFCPSNSEQKKIILHFFSCDKNKTRSIIVIFSLAQLDRKLSFVCTWDKNKTEYFSSYFLLLFLLSVFTILNFNIIIENLDTPEEIMNLKLVEGSLFNLDLLIYNFISTFFLLSLSFIT